MIARWNIDQPKNNFTRLRLTSLDRHEGGAAMTVVSRIIYGGIVQWSVSGEIIIPPTRPKVTADTIRQ